MRDLSLHILDIVENSIEAGASEVNIELVEDRASDKFTMRVRDNGKGMDEDIVRKIEDPFFTMKPGKSWGLGVPLLAQAARQCDGDFRITSAKGKGTEVVADFKASHIDMKPLGDIASTVVTLVAGHPEVDYSLICESDGERYDFGTAGIREALEGVPLNVPDVLKLIRGDINDGIRRTMHGR